MTGPAPAPPRTAPGRAIHAFSLAPASGRDPAVLLAALQVLLARYGARTDIRVGVHTGVPAPFAPRTGVDGDLPFPALLESVRGVARGGSAHWIEELPFAATFALRDALPGEAEATMLTLEVREAGVGTRATLRYDPGRYDAATVTRLGGHYRNLLDGIAADPRRRVGDLPLLDPAELRRLRVEWNATRADYPRDRCIHQLFEEQVERTPHAVALGFRGGGVTYRELDRRANRLARHLQRRGVGPETRVGVCVERSPAMIVAVLGILKAGGAYVPLDPAYPPARLRGIVEDCGVAVLVTRERLRGALPAAGPPVVSLEGDRAAVAAERAGRPRSGAAPDNLAYVLYTSGSTGPPKGVLVAHRGVCNVVTAKIRMYGVRPDSRVLQFVSLGFDVSAAEIFTALAAGARLCLGRPHELLPGPALLRLLREERITTVMMPPSALAALPYAGLPALESVVVGGERCPAELVARWAPGRRFFNTYGPTEASICNTAAECAADAGPPPIGRPIANTRVYLLDPHGRTVPAGVAGELYVGGVGVARGYHGRPALTAERFVPDPFAGTEGGEGETGARLYRTGDLARYRPDGCLEFVGRIDRQVKVRGVRVEPGEVEAALARHPCVCQAAVAARRDAAGGTRLAGYVVPRRGRSCAPAELRDFLRARLPGHMVPASLVVLDALPLTPNGKVDYAALPAPPDAADEEEAAFPAPRDAVEARVAGIWAALLGRQGIGVDESFFDVGGHSLLVGRLARMVREAFGVEPPLRAFLQAPTVAGLARLVRARRGGAPVRAAPVDWGAETALDSHIRPVAWPGEPSGPADVLLTGATGFLGAYVLHELLDRTPGRVVCLVRAPDAAEGGRRIRAALAGHDLWTDGLQTRIVPVAGDLALPGLGLGDEAFARLAAGVDAVYHVGGLVNFVYPYPLLKAANVLGTAEVLRLASLARRKPVHFVSTLAVFLGAGRSPAELVAEGDDPGKPDGLEDGYAQSKWVAERLVMEARRRGLPATLYRLARITGDGCTGRGNDGDLLSRVVRGCVQLGVAPDWDMLLDMAPVDFVARAIVHLSRAPGALGGDVHLMNDARITWRELVEELRLLGYPLRVVPRGRWRAALLAELASGAENALEPLLPLLSRARGVPLVSHTPRFDCRRTLAELAAAGIVPPPADRELLRTLLAHLARDAC